MLRSNPIAKTDNVKTLCDFFYFSREFYKTGSTLYRPHPRILEDWNIQLFVEKKRIISSSLFPVPYSLTISRLNYKNRAFFSHRLSVQAVRILPLLILHGK